MKLRLVSRAAGLLCLIALVPVCADAVWLENGNAVIDISNSQDDPMIVSDGEGGAIIGWRDPSAGNYDIFASRIDGFGNIIWGPVTVCAEWNDQIGTVMAPDGFGGALFAWSDLRNGSDYDIFAQRIDSGGNLLWTPDGEPVCEAILDQGDPRIAGDGTGGAVICWTDIRNGNWDIYAQRLSYSGGNVFVPDGVPVCTATGPQQESQITTDGKKGMFITWRDYRSGMDMNIYAQRIDYIGNPILTLDGNPIFTLPLDAYEPRIAFDGVGGAVIVWFDDRMGDNDIYAQRVRVPGSVEWKVNGEEITNAVIGNVQQPTLVSDGLGGSFIAWSDSRSGTWNIYAQRLDINGHALWTADGLRVITGDHNQTMPSIATDGDDGLLVVWRDDRNDQNDIYAQRFNENGQPLWGSEGMAVCALLGNQEGAVCVSDGAGGLIAAWEDWRNSNYDIFAQRIERHGHWGYPSGHISSVQDVTADQGGSINLSWDASRLDPWPEELITQYTVWRAVEEPALSMMFDGGAILVDDVAAIDLGSLDQAIRVQHLEGDTYYWKLVSTVDAYHLWGYSEVVPTLQDSTGGSEAVHYFQVIAHTNNPIEYWISPPDSGWSVDNLAPCPPLGLEGEQSFIPEGLALTWDPNTETDLSHYHIYRGVDAGFIPDPGNLVACTPDTNTFDGDWHWGYRYCYKVAAVDIHGNESEYALLLTDEVTDGETPPAAAFLDQNYPNPFNPSTRIRFGLKEAGHVNLRIYDAVGRLVRVLIDEERPSGRYEEIWNGKDGAGREAASGVYFYSLRAGAFKETRKMVLLR
jgi:hypothetical protein